MRRAQAAAAIAALAGLVCAAWYLAGPSTLPEGVSREEYANAQHRFQKMYGRRPGRLDALSLLGELAVADGRLGTAVGCFRGLPRERPRDGRVGRTAGG